MANKNYEMVTVYEYLGLNEKKRPNMQDTVIKKNVLKYVEKMNNLRKHEHNATLLETLLE